MTADDRSDVFSFVVKETAGIVVDDHGNHYSYDANKYRDTSNYKTKLCTSSTTSVKLRLTMTLRLSKYRNAICK